MDDCIYRQALIDLFQRVAYDDWGQGVVTTWAKAYKEAAALVEALPSADVEPVRHAKRIVVCHEENSYSYACEACGIPVDICDNFCRGCGAKLDGEEE